MGAQGREQAGRRHPWCHTNIHPRAEEAAINPSCAGAAGEQSTCCLLLPSAHHTSTTRLAFEATVFPHSHKANRRNKWLWTGGGGWHTMCHSPKFRFELKKGNKLLRILQLNWYLTLLPISVAEYIPPCTWASFYLLFLHHSSTPQKHKEKELQKLPNAKN